MHIGSILNGNTLILLALIVSLVSLFFLARSASGNNFALVTSRQLFYLTSILIVLTSIVLLGALLTHDFQNAYVYNNTSRNLPAPYLIAAFWAGTQGSFLLWLLILNVVGVIITRANDQNENILMSIITITQIFFLIILIVDSPFKPIWDAFTDVQAGFKPQDGSGMNPLLVDPWMVSHPPILFMGYASSIVPFGYALAALLKKDASILFKRAFPWVLFSSLSLGIGIFLGGYWAYKVLGWGGYWGWDPVENSSLIPWIISVTLIHGLVLQRRTGSLVRLNIGLSMVYFILVFYSTFLTRSGVLSDFSVHSFADYGLSAYLIFFMSFYIIIALVLFIKQFNAFKGAEFSSKIFAWDTLAAYGVIILMLYAVVILIGTSMPILSGLVRDNPAAVTEKFYNNISIPFGILIIILMSGSTMAMTLKTLANKRVYIVAGVSLVLGVLFNIVSTSRVEPYIFTVLALFAVIFAITELYSAKAGTILASRLTHIGTALMVIGIMASGFHSHSEQMTLYKDVPVELGKSELTFRGMSGKGKSTLQFSLKKGTSEKSFETDYYFDNKTHSWYRAPHIIHSFAGDTYITPLAFHSGIQEATSLLLEKNSPGTIDGITIEFVNFITREMTSNAPTILADLRINGKKVTPGIKIASGSRISLPKNIPGTARSVTLADVDVANKRVMLHITPGDKTVIPPDSAVIEVSHKRLIWLVWLGTIIIATGMGIAFYRKLRARKA